MEFIHFTSGPDAALIEATGQLQLSATIVGAVYAVAAGGANVPTVQHPRHGDATHAVIFTAEAPDTLFPEEVIWHRDQPLEVTNVRIVDARSARGLLDDSAGIPEDGLHHGTTCACAACRCRQATQVAHTPLSAR